MPEHPNRDTADAVAQGAPAARPAYISEAIGVAALTGQAVGVGRPPAGQTVFIESGPGDRYAIQFDPNAARVSIRDGSLQLSFSDGSRLVFQSLVDAAASGNAPVFEFGGRGFDSGLLLRQSSLLTNETLETAAGNTRILSGGGSYSDDLGETIALLGREGVIDPTELEFGLFEAEEEEFLGDALEALADDAASAGASPDSSDTPGGSDDDGPGDDNPDNDPGDDGSGDDNPGDDEPVDDGSSDDGSGDTPTVAFVIDGPAAISEGGSAGSYTLSLGGDVLGAGQAAFVRLSINPNTVSFGTDTDETLASLLDEIAASAAAESDVSVVAIGADFIDLDFRSSASLVFDLLALNDGLAESNPNESFTLALANVSGSGGVDAGIADGRGAVTTEILDAVSDPDGPGDQGEAPEVSFAIDGPTNITEGGLPGSYSVSMTGDALSAGQSAAIRISIDPGDVSFGSDTDQTLAELVAEIAAAAAAEPSVAVAGTGSDFIDLSFTGNTGLYFDIEALVDGLTENDPSERFTLSLESPNGVGEVEASVATGAGSVTTTILDAPSDEETPTAEDNYTQLTEAEAGAVNLLFILDASSSMLDQSGVGDLTRFDLMIKSFKTLLLAYEASGATVTAQVAEFGGYRRGNPPPGGGEEATISAAGLTVSEAVAVLDSLEARAIGSGLDTTNYRAATNIAIDNFESAPSAGDIIYFASDGAPNTGRVNVPVWERFLGSETRAIAVGIGQGVNVGELEKVAFPNVDENLVLVDGDGELAIQLQETIPASVSGNVITDPEDPSRGVTDVDAFGGDGAGTPPVVQISHVFAGEGPLTFDASSTESDPHVIAADGRTVTIETDAGARLSFDFETGAYVYVQPADVDEDFSEIFGYTIQDGNGTLSSANLVIDVRDVDAGSSGLATVASLTAAVPNLAPGAEDDVFLLSIESLASGTLLGNVINGNGSLGGLADSDANGDPLSVESVDVTSVAAGFGVNVQTTGLAPDVVASVDLFSDDGAMAITVAIDGSLTVSTMSGEAFADVKAGETAILAMDYGIGDGRGGQDEASAELVFAPAEGIRVEDADLLTLV